jgi:hypothetical protein
MPTPTASVASTAIARTKLTSSSTKHTALRLPTNKRQHNPRIQNPICTYVPTPPHHAQNVARLQPLSALGEAQEQGVTVVQRTLNGVPTGEQYVLGRIIGQGNYSKVYSCQLPSGSRVAVKKMPKSKLLTIKTMSSLSSELRILRDPDRSQRHPNILYIDDVLQSRSNLYIVMPMVGQVSSGGRGDIGQ